MFSPFFFFTPSLSPPPHRTNVESGGVHTYKSQRFFAVLTVTKAYWSQQRDQRGGGQHGDEIMGK
jgi:hypothetical protein